MNADEAEMLGLVRDLNRRGRHGGLVPLADIREATRGLVSRAEVDALLLAMERKYLLDLKIANDPRRLPDKGASGIPRGETVAYWAVTR